MPKSSCLTKQQQPKKEKKKNNKNLTDWTGHSLYAFVGSICVHITLLGPRAHSAQRWQIGAMHSESKSPDIRLLML